MDASAFIMFRTLNVQSKLEKFGKTKLGFISNLSYVVLLFESYDSIDISQTVLHSHISFLLKRSVRSVCVYIITPIQYLSHKALIDCLCCLHSIKGSLIVLLYFFSLARRDENCWIQMKQEQNKHCA